MKRRLNPNLVRIRTSGLDGGWVFLRDAEHTALGSEEGIGHVGSRGGTGIQRDSAALRQQLRETESALTALSGIPPEREPHTILTKDCFDFEGPVRVLIYSDRPFA